MRTLIVIMLILVALPWSVGAQDYSRDAKLSRWADTADYISDTVLTWFGDGYLNKPNFSGFESMVKQAYDTVIEYNNNQITQKEYITYTWGKLFSSLSYDDIDSTFISPSGEWQVRVVHHSYGIMGRIFKTDSTARFLYQTKTFRREK